MLNALHFSHQVLDNLINLFPQGNFIDATLGKGHDAHYILGHSKFNGQVYAFDIQEKAIHYSSEKLQNFQNFHPYLASHDQLNQYIDQDMPIHGAIFNLGYLPGAGHQITTQFPSTMAAIKQISRHLVAQAAIIVVVYSGHSAGKIERDQLLEELKHWPQDEYQILKYNFINQKNNPPFTLIIEKC